MENARKADAVVAGHICLDVIPDMSGRQGGMDDLLVPGKLVNIGPALTATGGAVSNTGQALHRLGVPVRLMGKIGGDMFGQAVLGLLRGQAEALAEGMIVAPGEHTSYTIVISPPGVDRVFLHCTGANDTFAADDLRYGDIAGSRLFHFGYPPLMRRMYEESGRELASMFARVKRLGVTTSLDMAKPDPGAPAGRVDWEALLVRTLPDVDVFLPSFEELLYMLDRSKYDELERLHGPGRVLDGAAGADGGELLRGLADRLLAMGAAIAGVKLGEHGLYVRTTGDASRLSAMGACAPRDAAAWAGRELLAPCFAVQVAGTTGAGDCTIAGFLAGLLHGLPLERVVLGAVAVGACNVEQADATSGIPGWDAVQRRIAGGWARRETGVKVPGLVWDETSGQYVNKM